jgi:hypothetical protein
VLGTGGMVRHAHDCDADVDVIGTEVGLLHRLHKEAPSHTFVPLREDAVCEYMKTITFRSSIGRCATTSTRCGSSPTSQREHAGDRPCSPLPRVETLSTPEHRRRRADQIRSASNGNRAGLIIWASADGAGRETVCEAISLRRHCPDQVLEVIDRSRFLSP